MSDIAKKVHKLVWDKDPVVARDGNSLVLGFGDEDNIEEIMEIFHELVITNPQTGKLHK